MTFDAQVQSITQDEIVPAVVDNVLGSNALTLIFLANGRPWAGESMKSPVKLSSHTQGGSFSDYGQFNIQGENVRQTASFDPRAYYQSVVLGGIAMSVNKVSKSRVLDLVKVEMESAHQDMVDDIGGLVYGTGSNGTDFLGLDAGIDDNSNVTTYGGLSRATYTAWRSTIQTSVGAYDFSKARTLMNSASVGNQKPTVEVADETTFGYIEADYTSTISSNVMVDGGQRARLTRKGVVPASQGGLVGQAGFDILFYAGTPIIKDDKCDSQKIFAVNTNYFRWYGLDAAEATPINLKDLYHEGNDYNNVPSSLGFNWTGFVRPADQYNFVGQIILLGNFFTFAPRLHSSSAGVTS